jgi:predicted alpha-1,6-mannanase (GH76 family)
MPAALHCTSAACAVLACALLATAGCGGAAARSPVPSPSRGADHSAENARESLASFDKAFYSGTAGSGYYRLSEVGGTADFWKEAEMIETAEDYYRYTRDPAYKQLVLALCEGFTARYGTDWTKKYTGGKSGTYLGPRANDDIMWMVIASARAYQITGTAAYRDMAARNFEAAYSRSWSSDFGGGIWWRTATGHAYRAEKNTTTNAPAAIAACVLYEDFRQQQYLDRAEALFAWVRSTLYDPATGRVLDHIGYTAGGGTRTYRTRFSYNQGSFIGAATLLYSVTHKRAYYADARRALDYTRAHMTTAGILTDPGVTPGQDTGGFKGIFARWAVRFARDNGITAYDAWFRQNAAAVWAQRNARGLTGPDWITPTAKGPLYSWDCSSGVAMLETLLPAPPPQSPPAG